MIIEFVGAPGVGKTTLARKLFEEMKSDGYEVEWPWEEIFSKGYAHRNIKKSFNVAATAVWHPVKAYRVADFVFNAGGMPIRDRLTVLFNGIFLLGMLLSARRKTCASIFDEGVCQWLLAVYARSQTLPTTEDINRALRLFGSPDKLFVVNADIDVIRERVRTRARKVGVYKNANFTETLSLMRTLLYEFCSSEKLMYELHVIDNNSAI